MSVISSCTVRLLSWMHARVAHKIAIKYIEEYNAPVNCVLHYPIWKADSKSTLSRTVFDASANCGGIVMNSFWANGPDLITNLLGILFRSREGQIAVTKYIRKTCHEVKFTGIHIHTHRLVTCFIWWPSSYQQSYHSSKKNIKSGAGFIFSGFWHNHSSCSTVS